MSAASAQLKPPPGIDNIQTVVIIYAENRSFDNLYGSFPGRTVCATRQTTTQLDRDGKPLKELPPVWDGLTAKGVTPVVTQAQTEHLAGPPIRRRWPEGLRRRPERHHARSLAPVLPEPDADRRRP